jgi:DNA-binding MarR family transcriptional regulator
MKKPLDAYIRFLTLAQKITDPMGAADLDLTAMRLLDQIVISEGRGELLTVTEAMCLSSIASPATLHRKVDELLKTGYIQLTHKGDNRRTKYLNPTKRAVDHYKKLGIVLIKAST